MTILVVPLAAFLVALAASVIPAGPIAVLVVQKASEGAYRKALFVGLGAAVVEGVYALIASSAFGLVVAHLREIHLLGRVAIALVLPAFGLRFLLWKDKVANPAPDDQSSGGLWLGASVAALNPLPLLTWTTVVTVLDARHFMVKGPVVGLLALGAAGGVFTWNALVVHLLRRRQGQFPRARMNLLIRCLGFVLIGVGLWSAIQLTTGRS